MKQLIGYIRFTFQLTSDAALLVVFIGSMWGLLILGAAL